MKRPLEDTRPIGPFFQREPAPRSTGDRKKGRPGSRFRPLAGETANIVVGTLEPADREQAHESILETIQDFNEVNIDVLAGEDEMFIFSVTGERAEVMFLYSVTFKESSDEMTLNDIEFDMELELEDKGVPVQFVEINRDLDPKEVQGKEDIV